MVERKIEKLKTMVKEKRISSVIVRKFKNGEVETRVYHNSSIELTEGSLIIKTNSGEVAFKAALVGECEVKEISGDDARLELKCEEETITTINIAMWRD